MLHKKISVFIVISTLSISVAIADVQSDITAGLSLDAVLKNAVTNGQSISEAAVEVIQLYPEERAGDVVTAAVNLLTELPSTACRNVESNLSTNAWRTACETNIVQAAIAADIDPATVTAAAAAGRAPFVLSQAARQEVQRVRTRGSAVIPNNGAGGGLVMSGS
ncbi:MAG: hypothetical protein GXP14_16160 [Gammaproteobacteria bacterium]|nr:hypothetical protein [Gammaproteobacteria bacterium]